MIVQLCRLIVNSSSSDSAELCKNGPSLNEWRGGDCGRELNTETGARVGCRGGHSDDELEKNYQEWVLQNGPIIDRILWFFLHILSRVERNFLGKVKKHKKTMEIFTHEG